ncbi:MAG: GNAT family N-acetyltransferase [Anaerolineales bacterium]
MKTIRRIRIGEFDLFKQIRLRALKEAPYAFSSTYESALQRSEESWREQAENSAQGSDRATFIAFSDDAPVGIAALYRVENQTNVGAMLQVWVAPEHRGTGVARDLIDAIFEWAGENNFRMILSRIRDGNIRAQKFYTKYGFSNSDEFSSSDFDGVCLVKEVL